MYVSPGGRRHFQVRQVTFEEIVESIQPGTRRRMVASCLERHEVSVSISELKANASEKVKWQTNAGLAKGYRRLG